MDWLARILESIKHEINTGTICELELEGEPVSYVKMPKDKFAEELSRFTEALIESAKSNTFTPFKVHISWMCKLRLEQGVRLSDIMAFFDLYETSVKDAMSIFLKEDLVSLNKYRRDIDSLLDRARVFVSEYFFTLYEETVYEQFEQLRTINEITAYLTSSLDLNEVLDFIVVSAVRLFKADCGSILLIDKNGSLHAPVTAGWHETSSSAVISETIAYTTGVMDWNYEDLLSDHMHNVFKKESLSRVKAIKLYLQELTIGVLIIGFRSTRRTTPVDQKLLETFANHAAIAVHNAQLYGDADFKLKQRIHEVTVILEQKRAIMHCMREGVVAINVDGYINLANHEAKRLLGREDNIIGRHIRDIIPNSRLPIVIKNRQAEYDQEQEVGNKVIITNRVPLIVGEAVIGAIATFRDKQDVKLLAEELVGLKSLLESMRAQSHEFANKLHAISGLIQMKQYDKVVELITLMYKSQQDLVSSIVKRVKDQATAGLLIGKISQSSEQGITLRLNPRSKMGDLPPSFSSLSMVTVLGNLISNAMEAVAQLPAERRVIDVYVFEGKQHLNIKVSDLGKGIPEPYKKKIYQRGFSTKQGNRGVGLALVKQEVQICGGKITVNSRENEGTTFWIKIPVG
ncbi:ATP-binding protein [Sporomusa sp.]|uniref:ATP-binding protein n=1 Tax=Sporomusa sp. TaxID=2078658 RepID=UPI002CFE0A1A|nr:ATP-binding protein [Sporomusa sp.]HWR45891.1 ATP-binding protein [Sporomusa sp.]